MAAEIQGVKTRKYKLQQPRVKIAALTSKDGPGRREREIPQNTATYGRRTLVRGHSHSVPGRRRVEDAHGVANATGSTNTHVAAVTTQYICCAASDQARAKIRVGASSKRNGTRGLTASSGTV